MMIKKDHELHKRRAKSNLLLLAVLLGFVALVFAVTIVKMVDQSNNQKTTVGSVENSANNE